jgi:hypothetical protein
MLLKNKTIGVCEVNKMIELVEAKSDHRELLWSLLQKYLYEMTNYYDDEIDEMGNKI